MKYDSSGSVLWTSEQGTVYSDYGYGYGVAVSGDGFIYVTGLTYGSLNGQTDFYGGDIFLMKYDSTESVKWTSQQGTPTNSYTDQGKSVATSGDGFIYVTGTTRGYLNGQTNKGRQYYNYHFKFANKFFTQVAMISS